MKVISTNVYTFDELSAEAKEKALEWGRDLNVGRDDWYTCVYEDYETKLADLGYKDIKMYFSGFWSQGDGACFTASIDIPAWLKAHKLSKYRALAQAYRDGDAIINITHNWRYYFATSTDVDPNDYRASEKAQIQMEDVVARIEKEREIIGNELYRALEKNYEYLASDREVAETIRINEYTFTKEGKRFAYGE